MTTRELTDYVENELKNGEQKDAIKARLLQNGWSSNDIEETFGVVENKTASTNDTSTIPTNNRESPKTTSRFLTILSVVGIFIGFNLISVFSISALATNYSVFIKPVTYLGEGQTDIGGWIFIVGISFFIASIVLSIFFVLRQKRFFKNAFIFLISVFGALALLLGVLQGYHVKNKREIKEVKKYIQQQKQQCRNDDYIECISKITYPSDKLMLCRYSSSQSDRESCYAGIATAKKDISICDTLIQETEAVRSSCRIKTMFNRAIREKDVSFCEQLENEEKIPRHYKGREYKIDIGLEISNCYRNLAVMKSDIKICEKLEEPQDRELCEYHYNVTKK